MFLENSDDINQSHNIQKDKSKMSYLKTKLPPISLPSAKRSQFKRQHQNQIPTNTELLRTKPKKLAQIVQHYGKALLDKKKAAWSRQFSMPQYITQTIEYEQLKINEAIINVLQFIYNQFSGSSSTLVQPLKVLYHWQVTEIQTNIRDINLGDFVMKCPNPDNLPPEYIQKYEELQESDGNVEVSLYQAIQFYDDMFDMDSEESKLLSKNEKIAFIIAFFLLDIEGKHNPKAFEKVQSEVKQFQNLFNYFYTIKELEHIDFLNLRKKPDFHKIQSELPLQVYEQIQTMCQQFYEIEDKKQIAQMFQNFKQNLFKNLNFKLKGKKKNIYDPFIAKLLLTSQSVTKILKYFPDFLEDTILYAKRLNQKQTRKLCKGQYLKKVVENNKLRWVIAKKRPTDVMTLLRKFIIYRLTQRGGLFLRTFLSQDETSIFLVLKTSQKILQRNAQVSKTQMQVELGSTDLFSFEPVDSYYRPLRVNQYIRDPQFIHKYNLNSQKQDKDKSQGERSIESEMMNFYRKGERMNSQELRAKIILDQQQADQCYKWVGNKLGIDYIKPKQVLLNEYNYQEIQPDIWEIYYVYNKFIIQYINRVKFLYKSNEKSPKNLKNIDKNVGMLLRLMFLKAQYQCNNLYYNFREIKGITPRFCSNLCGGKDMALKNIWNHLGIDIPKGFWTYVYTQKLDRIWRKYEINQLKERSKFFPAARLTITNSIILQNMNITKAISQKYIMNFYPIHDPFILKNIKIEPYINVIKNLIKKNDQKKLKKQEQNQHMMDDLYRQYECHYSRHDFTKDSIEQKLNFKFGKINEFSMNTVRYYCGEKIALFFQFRRFIAQTTFPWIFLAFIIQIFFWVEIVDIIQIGSSPLQEMNNVLTFILAIFNVLFITRMSIMWRIREMQIAHTFGVDKLSENQSKRVSFEGSFKRQFQTDQMNFQYKPMYSIIFRRGFTYLITLAYIILMALVIILIFVFKTYLFQTGQPQELVSVVPSLLISIAVQVFNKLYTILIKAITDFEEHKTVNSYESSLVLKAFFINFLVTFYALFIFAFFSQYLDAQFLCLLRTNNGRTVVNCYYYVSTQLTSLVLVDFLTTIIAAFVPFITFKITQYLKSQEASKDVTFNSNYFESLDQYFEEQDQMSSSMYNEQIDGTWLGYIKYISIFTALALFGPALPLIYVMLYLTGIIGLHSGKYELIYLTKRSLPIKTNSINIWLVIIEFVAVLGIVVNFAFVIYVRNLFENEKSTVFFMLILFSLIIKYLLSVTTDEKGSQMFKRNEQKTLNLLHERGGLSKLYDPEPIFTDLENVVYDQNVLHRKFPNLREANVKTKKKKDKK